MSEFPLYDLALDHPKPLEESALITRAGSNVIIPIPCRKFQNVLGCIRTRSEIG